MRANRLVQEGARPSLPPAHPELNRPLLQDTVSVHRPSFYAERFFKFMSNTVFRKNSCEPPRGMPQSEGSGRPLSLGS